MEKKKTEKKRTSKQQFTLYVKKLSMNPLLVRGKLTPNMDPGVVDRIWEQLTAELNSCGDGPIKSMQEWKKVFTEWKSHVRKRAREKKPLSEIETSLIDILGKVAVVGLDNPEIGIDTRTDLTELTEVTNDENIEYVYEDEQEETEGDKPEEFPEESVLRAQGTAKKKKRAKEPLLVAYENGNDQLSKGMHEIAVSLQSIADSINRYCDILERRSNYDTDK